MYIYIYIYYYTKQTNKKSRACAVSDLQSPNPRARCARGEGDCKSDTPQLGVCVIIMTQCTVRYITGFLPLMIL